MAHVDLSTGKIYGCKKGTKTYYHEEGHIKYGSTPRGDKVRIWQEISLDLLITSTALAVINPLLIIRALVLIFLLSKIFSTMVEERDCWKYAENKLRGVKNVWNGSRKIPKI